MTGAWQGLASLVPAPIGRDQARDLARRELDKPIYHRDEPSVLDRFFDRVGEWLDSLFRQTHGPGPGGGGGGVLAMIVIVVLILVVVGLVLWWARGGRNTKSEREALLEGTPSAARDHRALAERHAAAGEWAEAIRERLRAIARGLEERVILDPRPGRTADELAAEAGVALPEHAEELMLGVRIFDDVWYGDRPGTEAGYARLKRLDERVQAAKPRPMEQGEPASTSAWSPM
ncbi:DUF4129 domain-containing protein [Actinomadura scrupuli]|uniref:DUF4129 domain-containing protein n=1 Tax=Actinomadura scrupuli TaxID=559629 RepID=UPI003D972AF0